VALGLIAAPDIPEKIAKEIATEQPDHLARHIDNGVFWDVSVVVDPLTGTERELPRSSTSATSGCSGKAAT
jgi:hypothetical protein